MLKCWIEYVHYKDEMVECLTGRLNNIIGGNEMTSYSGSPLSIGGSRFYDGFSSGSDSAGTLSLSSSVSSLQSFMYVDDSNNDQLQVKRVVDSRSQTPFDSRFADSRPSTPFRKTSQAYDTVSITSDVLSNASNLKSVAIRYCLRVINQSEKIPRRDSDRSVITASVVEAIGILNILCAEDASVAQKVYVEIKRLYRRIEHNPLSARRVFVALIQFFIKHHVDMLLHVDDVLVVYFRDVPTKFYQNQTAALELLTLCIKNSEYFKTKTDILGKYFPNILKLIAWWPCTFLEEASELIEIFLNPSNCSEVFHAILDLPCLSALLYLKSEKILEDNNKLEEVLSIPIKPYFKAMFLFILRETSGGAETIDKLTELHNSLAALDTNPLVKYVSDIVPVLLLTYFDVMAEINDENAFRNVFPVILERVYQLYPRNERQNEILDILSEQVEFISRIAVDVVSLNYQEILQFFTLVHTSSFRMKCMITSVVWCIGENASNDYCSNIQVTVLYETLETLVYESSQSINSHTNALAHPEVVSSLIAALSKLAAFSQELIPRAIMCLTKISTQQYDDSSRQLLPSSTLLAVTTYAQEMLHILQKPKAAPSILCDIEKRVPWHLDADASLLMKIHVLSDSIDDSKI